MAILLFTDFGARDLYAGQVELALDSHAPGVRVVHLLNHAPAFDIIASAHLLAALSSRVPRAHVILGVVDPGVGTARAAVVMQAEGRWFVGPDNGLFAVVAGRAAAPRFWRIAHASPAASVSFHGRDVFAPLAAAIETGAFPGASVVAVAGLAVTASADDRAAIIYLDHYGNAFTGLRAAGMPTRRRLIAADRAVAHARVFADAVPGEAFWYENSIGLVEIAVNQGRASDVLGLAIGQPVAWERG